MSSMFKFLLPLVLLIIPSAVLADPVSIAIGTAATLGSAWAIGVTISSLMVMKVVAFNVAMSLLQKSLAPSAPSLGALGGGVGRNGYQVTGLAPAGDHAIIYGETKVGGVVVFKEVTDNNKYLHSIIALAGHECEAITAIFLNDEAVTLDGNGVATAPDKYIDKVRIIKHLGSDTQSADTLLVDESNGSWTSDHRLQGICYLYVRLEFDADAFPNGEPAITATLQGKKIYNPNTGVTEYSKNAALCLRDYLTASYGLGAETSEIDDLLFISAANVCDENVPLAAGGTEKRYECNGTFTTGSQPIDVIESLSMSMGGTIWYSQGKWRVRAASYNVPVLSFDENDMASGFTVETRHSRRNNFNVVKGKFRGADSNYQETDYPEIRSTVFISDDGGEESVIDLNFDFVSSPSMAQRIAKIGLYKNREQLTLQGTFFISAMQFQIGDTINITNSRLGFVSKPFEVHNWTMRFDAEQGFVVDVVLRETSSSVYDWNAEETAFENNNTNLSDAFDVPSVGLSTTSEARVINEHLTNVIIATVTSDSPERIDNVEFQFKKTSQTDYKLAGFGELGSTEILDVEDDEYDVRVRAINTFGIKGPFVTQTNITVEGLSDPPANITNFSFNVSSAGIHLEWDAVPDLDLSFYRIRYTPLQTSATYANATTAVDKVARPANSVTVPPRAGTYMIKAYDKSGNQSQLETPVTIREQDLDVFTTTNTQAEHPAFSGTKTGCSVSSSRLRITDPSTAPSTATYLFSNYIDTGAVRIGRVSVDVDVLRISDAATDTFDTLTGLFDSLPSLFDDLSGGTSFSDNNVITFVSTTDDNPSGTPTWSAYKRFKTGDFSGRAFRFKIELQSTANDITPAIEELTAKVKYN